jgi:hypothetical protein
MFSQTDLADAYWQIPLKEDQRHLFAFRTGVTKEHPVHGDVSHLEPTRLVHGYKWAGEAFAEATDIAFRPLLKRNALKKYADDARAQSHGIKQHMVDLREFLSLCRKYGLKLKLKKSKFFVLEVHQMGMIFDGKTVRPDPERLQGIKDFPQPKTIKELIQFLAMCNYHMPSVSNLAERVEPLRSLADTGSVRGWGSVHTAAFEGIKESLINATTRVIPDPTRPFVLRIDASKIGAGAALIQYDAQGVERVVMYMSHRWQGAEMRRNTTEKEGGSAIRWLRKCAKYFLLSPGANVIQTDHRNLIWMLTSENEMVQRWAAELLSYNLIIQHIPGISNVVADTLSRVLREAVLGALVMRSEEDSEALTALAVLGSEWATKVAETQDSATERAEWETRPTYKQTTTNGVKLWTRDGKIVIPVEATHLQRELLDLAHEKGGHGGVKSTLDRLRRGPVTWANLKKAVSDHVASCPACQRVKAPSDTQDVGTLTPFSPVGPFQHVVIDYLGPLPESALGNKYILVLVDRFTRWIELVATPAADAASTMKALKERLFHVHGAPKVLQSDQGSHFKNADVEELCGAYGVEQYFSLEYYPEENGVVGPPWQNFATTL